MKLLKLCPFFYKYFIFQALNTLTDNPSTSKDPESLHTVACPQLWAQEFVNLPKTKIWKSFKQHLQCLSLESTESRKKELLWLDVPTYSQSQYSFHIQLCQFGGLLCSANLCCLWIKDPFSENTGPLLETFPIAWAKSAQLYFSPIWHRVPELAILIH